MLLFQDYAKDDLRSGGMSNETLGILMKDSLGAKEKWHIIKPYWDASLNTAYNRVALLIADKLYGIKDINESNIDRLSKKIEYPYQTETEQKKWVDHVLLKMCKINFLIQDLAGAGPRGDPAFGNDRFRHVIRLDNFISLNSKQTVRSIEKQESISIETFDDYTNALEHQFKKATAASRVVGIKTTLAGSRIIHFESVQRAQAQKIFESIMKAPEERTFSFSELKPVQDYMMHRVLDIAKEYDIPVAIHTGLQGGTGNIIENSKPTHLVNLFREYPAVNFVLYHGSYPYGGELAALAKNYRNVYIDMCWLHSISPSYSQRYLHEWIETVPVSKIMAFGGDSGNVENTYGNLLLAKQIVASVFAGKVKDGYLSEEEAKRMAQMILHDNALRLYKLSI